MGTFQNAFSMSILASWQPWPSVRTLRTTSLTFSEHVDLSMPSLMLLCFGCDRSRIKHHLCECSFGTAPRLLMWRKEWVGGYKGPRRRPFVISVSRLLDIMLGCSLAEGWLDLVEVHVRRIENPSKSLGYTRCDVLREELVGLMLHQHAPGLQIKWGNDVC